MHASVVAVAHQETSAYIRICFKPFSDHPWVSVGVEADLLHFALVHFTFFGFKSHFIVLEDLFCVSLNPWLNKPMAYKCTHELSESTR